MWEFEDPDGNHNNNPLLPDQVVMKETTKFDEYGNHSLDDEAQIHEILSNQNSEHIPKLLAIGDPLRHNQLLRSAGAIPDAWLGKSRRMFMEYCPLGDLGNLIRRRVEKYEPHV